MLNAAESDTAGGVSAFSAAGPGVGAKVSPAATSGVAVAAGKGIVASGGGVVARVAPLRSDVVSEAKCPGVRPPVRQRT